MKLIDKKPNIVNGTSYADLKECLIKIEKSGYLNYIKQNLNTEVSTILIIQFVFCIYYNIYLYILGKNNS